MSGDYSRINFDPRQDDLGVLLQQGRPLSDAEWNAATLQLRRRIHAGTLDTIGTAVVPLQTPDGFKITVVAGGLGIGRGRIYVDGLLAENHGTGTKAWEPRLEEQIGTQPALYSGSANDLAVQPYYPNPPALPTGGPHLIYLDVWQREVTHLIRPDLIEKAVGVDSTTRLQTVWQVKLLNKIGPGVDCSTPLEKIPGWLPANAPSAGRLSTSTAVVPGQPDPCLIPPGSGYKGLENQLYRIEIHTGGGLGTATFKWSRENASVETRVTHIPALNQLTVESVGKDPVLRFSDGDWVEITDDWLELHNQPGELRRIKIGNGVDDATRTIILDQPLTAGLFPTDAMHRTQPGRHTRVKRWDQRGQVLDQNGNVLQDLDPAAANGEITVPSGAGISVLLEHGIIATFTLVPAGGQFKPGDYWVFAARSGTDAFIEELDQAPPLGIHHHYAKLGIVSFPGTITDCRTFWPPTADDCACTVCVTPQAHASGTPSLQMAIQEVIKAGGGTVCLEAGVYKLKEPLLIQGARSLRITGKGDETLLQAAAGAILVQKSHDISLQSFKAVSHGETKGAANVIGLLISDQIRIEHVNLVMEGNGSEAAALGLSGALADVLVRGNKLQAPVGILGGGATPKSPETGVMDLRVENNAFECGLAAVRFRGVTVHQFISRFAGNRVISCTEAGFELTGATVPGSGIEIVGNEFHVLGDAIVAGVDGLRVVDNDLILANPSSAKQQGGIVLTKGMTGASLDDAQITGNRIVGFDTGIAVQVPLGTVAIARNQIAKTEIGLLVGPVASLSIDYNQMSAIKNTAIQVRSKDGRIAVSGNQLEILTDAPGVTIECGGGDCVFSDNHSRQLKGGDKSAVRLTARTLVVASNRIVGRGVGMILQPDLDPKKLPLCTVLGNITGGPISVSSGALPMPWASLNLQNIV